MIKCRFCSGEPSDQPKGLDLGAGSLTGPSGPGGQLALLSGRSVAAEGFLAAAAEYHGQVGVPDWLSRSIFASHYGRRGCHSGAQPF